MTPVTIADRSLNSSYPKLTAGVAATLIGSTQARDSLAFYWQISKIAPLHVQLPDSEGGEWLLSAAAYPAACWPVAIERRGIALDAIEQAALGAYASLPFVRAIYSSQYRAERQFIVFVNAREYGQTMLDQLLDFEYELQKKYSTDTQFISVSYVPVDISDSGIIPEAAKCIFSRG